MQKKWAQITEILTSTITSSAWKVWIEPLKPEFGQNCLRLYAPNSFMADFTIARFAKTIQEALHRVCGADYTLEICTNKKYEPKKAALARPTAPAKQQRSESLTKNIVEPKVLKATKAIKEVGSVSMAHNEFKQKKTHKKSKLAPNGQAALPRLLPILDQESTPFESAQQTLASGRAFLTSKTLTPQTTNLENLVHPTVIPSPRPLPPMQLALPVTVPNRNAANIKNWRFCFDDFVVGSCNELAFAASRNMCSEFMQANTLYLNSSPGLGKTHLLQAVGHDLSVNCNRATSKVEYLTAEEFTSQFLFSLHSRSVDQFKARYRTLDLLLLEDVHFLQGKEQTQMEFLATMKSIHDRGGKVVLTSSFSLRDLKTLDEQLLSRLSSGFISPIDKPDFETRCRIFRQKASKHQVILPREVEELLAEHIQADVRQIESCLQNMILKAQLYKTGITVQMAWDVISNYASQRPDLGLESIIQQICKLFSLNQEQLFSPKRKKDYVLARNAAFYLARKHTKLSLESIGQRFNKKHSTVLKGITNLEREMSRQTPEGRQIENTISIIERGSRPA